MVSAAHGVFVSHNFASGKYAIGLCDICGFQYKLNSLKPLSVKGRNTGLLVCKTCWNESHPQLRQGEQPVRDPQALRSPRPDPALDASRELTGTWEETLAKLTRNWP